MAVLYLDRVGPCAAWRYAALDRLQARDRQRIYFANHTSHIDTVALWSALPPDLRAKTRTAAAADYWGSSALKRTIALQALNAVLIDRKRADPEADPLRPLYDVLEAGQSITFFRREREGRSAFPLLSSRVFTIWRSAFPTSSSFRSISTPASQHAEGDFLSGAADLHGALWRALPRLADEDKPPFSNARATPSLSSPNEPLPQALLAYWRGSLLIVASVIGRILRARVKDEKAAAVVDNLIARVRAWWWMVAVSAAAFLLGRNATIAMFASSRSSRCANF